MGCPNIESKLLRKPAPGKTTIIAIFAFRYDAHLVPDLIKNISPFVHGWVAWDDRSVDHQFTGDATRRSALFEAAKDLGADWILAADPDERYENKLVEKIESLTNNFGPVCWTFDCRELFDPNRFRVDGLWHDRPRVRLYPCAPGMAPDATQLHSSWTKNEANIPTRDSGLCFYHLRMTTGDRRRHRRELYAAADPDREFQSIGYDYIDDERGMELEHIQPARGYSPIHLEDNGLWAPPIGAVGEPKNDPLDVKLRRLGLTLRKGGGGNAAYLATDIYRASKQDVDLGVMAVELCLRVEQKFSAARMCKEIVNLHPTLLLPKSLLSRVQWELGCSVNSHRIACDTAASIEFDSLLLQQQVQRTVSFNEKLYGNDALWRRWVENAELFNGKRVLNADMAVVVISYRAPPELAEAVASLLKQDEQAEVIVVNSGGGDIAAVLGEYLEHVRLISVEERIFAGTARNIGIDASIASHIAFLASDCTAEPGWVRNRMSRHRAGAAAVSSAVVPADSKNLPALASHFLMHWRRRPVPEADINTRYGVSCTRRVFDSCGYFPTGLRLGEDSWYNEVLRESVGIVWAPDVVSTHRYPITEKSLIDDMRARGRRRAQYPPFATFTSIDDLETFANNRSRSSVKQAVLALDHANILESHELEIVSGMIKRASEADVAGIKQGWQNTNKATLLIGESESDDTAVNRQRLEQAIELWPQCVLHRIKLAGLLCKTQSVDNIEKAITLLRDAIAISPANAESLTKLCSLLSERGDPEAAMKAAEQACLMSPTQLPLWRELNLAASRIGCLPMQVYALQKMLTLAPSNRAVQSSLSKLHCKSGQTELSEIREEMLKALA